MVDIINYYSLHVEHLHKVKLAKMLWYADILSYKRTGKAITGLVYKALPMGAVPEGYEQIISLDNVKYETFYYDNDRIAYKFYPSEGFEIKELSDYDIKVLNTVISVVGSLNTKDIIEKMHNEDAYKQTALNKVISFSHSETLSIN